MPKQILDNTPFLLAHCSRDLRYVYVTKSYAAMLGRAPDDIVGKPIVEIIGAEGFKEILPHIERVLRGQRAEYEAAHITPIGTRQHYVIYVPEHNEQNQVIGWIASMFDITDLKKDTEKERLEKLVAEMRLPLSNANIGMWDCDIRGDNLSCTPELEAIYGLQVTGRPTFADFRERVHPDDIHDLLARRDAAIRARTTFQLEYRIIRPDGQMRWVMAVGGAVYDKVTGEPIRLMGTSFDVTETKANEVQAERRRKERAHLMRVAILGGLSGRIAHELNQPLASILANAQAAQKMLAKNNPDWEGFTEILQEIVEEDTRAGGLIRHLREKLQKGDHREASINLNELILSTLQLLRSELVSRAIKVDTKMKPDLTVSGNSAKLQQVLINLIVNAIEAMGSTPPSQRMLSIASRETEEGYVEVSIRDRGPGMSSDQLKRVFEPFFTTKAGGLGLGLSICSHIIITLHRGQLTLRKAQGGGMVATVSLPKNVQVAMAS